MHRSGTSALARILNLGGMHLGPDEQVDAVGADNPTGYWEHQGFRVLNDDLLARLGGSWADPPVLEPGWEESETLDALADRARELERTHFARASCWGWKDPRTSLTLPFWLRLWPDLRLIVCVRSPLAVAESIRARNLLPEADAGELWFEYTVAALAHTAARPRVVIHYEDLLADWSAAYREVVRALDLRQLAPAEAVRPAVERFLAAELAHHHADLSEILASSAIDYRAKSLYALLRSAPPHDRWNDVLDGVALAALREKTRDPELLKYKRRMRAALEKLGSMWGQAERHRAIWYERTVEHANKLRSAELEIEALRAQLGTAASTGAESSERSDT